jgi:hypothetical protein
MQTDIAAFSSKSTDHSTAMECFQKWVELSNQMMIDITPHGYSVVQLHHFVNERPTTPPPADEEMEDSEVEDDEFD